MKKFQAELYTVSGNAVVKVRAGKTYDDKWSNDHVINTGDTVTITLDYANEPDEEINTIDLPEEDLLRGSELYRALDDYLADLYQRDLLELDDVVPVIRYFGRVINRRWGVK